ncbi:MAG: TatD family hydrolase [Clostridia bacterium]|nr:TatD family hydrolase [Clostridia bacterium]
MKYFDSHAHYYDERFKEEYNGSVDDLIGALLSSDVSYIVNVGTSPDTCRAAISQAKRYKNMYTALGIHPSDAQRIDTGMDVALADIESLIKDGDNKCVALGEIGLDYHYPDTDRKLQHKYFDAQMTLAREFDIPVVIHDRDSHLDIIEVIKRHPGVRGVLHSFSGSVEMAREIVELGYMISFSGTLTFTNARRPKEVARAIPREAILIETDCPYLAPHPKRGTLNHSGNLVYTNSVLAELLGISAEECAALTTDNARRFFGI